LFLVLFSDNSCVVGLPIQRVKIIILTECVLLYCLCCHSQQTLNVKLRILRSVYSLWTLGVLYEVKSDSCGNYFRPSDWPSISKYTVWRILCFVDRASRYNRVKQNQLDVQFILSIFRLHTMQLRLCWFLENRCTESHHTLFKGVSEIIPLLFTSFDGLLKIRYRNIQEIDCL